MMFKRLIQALKNVFRRVLPVSQKMVSEGDLPPAGATISLEALIALQRDAKGICFHQNQRVSATQGGGYLSRFRGWGMDFAEVRNYQPGDDIRLMDWRVTARCGKPHMKVFQEERERPVFLVVDQGASMQFGTRVAFKSVVAAQAAALLAWAAAGQGDRVGGIVFGREQPLELRPYGRQRGVLSLLKVLSQPSSPVSAEGGLHQALGSLQRMAHPGSYIILISDFIDFDEEAARYVGALARHCKVQGIMVYDPLEKHLPPEGNYRFTDDQQTLKLETHDPGLQARFHQQFQQRINTVTSHLNAYGIPMIQLGCADSVSKVLRSLG